MSTSSLRPASVARWHDEPPQIEDPGARTWVARGANFVVAVTEAGAGARLERHAQADEYMVLLTVAGATIRAGGATLEAGPESLTIVPPGDSEVVVHGAGQVVRVFSLQAPDLLAAAGNARDYARPTPDVAPLVPWPAPAGGFRLRHYPLARFTQGDSNMRLFRSTNLMVNVMTPRMVARDVHKLSPHQHADFEQGSLSLRGQWVHHMRYPWGPDLSDWRDDEHVEVGSPSLTVIPPKVVHTSRNLNDGGAWLLDIFAPPRMDFSSKPGKVANEDDYPLPTAGTPASV
jgi:mannose-6-phosphate isomerase-like protein (cupin superfamily)